MAITKTITTPGGKATATRERPGDDWTCSWTDTRTGRTDTMAVRCRSALEALARVRKAFEKV